MRDITVTHASTEEWPQIAAMREEHYLRTHAEPIRVPDAAKWAVALHGERVVACAAVVERDVNGTLLWITDMYCQHNRLGYLGLCKIIEWLELSDARIAGTIPVWNKRMLNALARRNYYPVEITMEKDQRVRAI